MELSGLTMVRAPSSRATCAPPNPPPRISVPPLALAVAARGDGRGQPRRHQGLRTRHVEPAMVMTRSSASTMLAIATIALRPWWTTSPVQTSGPPVSRAGRRNRTFISPVT